MIFIFVIIILVDNNFVGIAPNVANKFYDTVSSTTSSSTQPMVDAIVKPSIEVSRNF